MVLNLDNLYEVYNFVKLNIFEPPCLEMPWPDPFIDGTIALRQDRLEWESNSLHHYLRLINAPYLSKVTVNIFGGRMSFYYASTL